VTRVTGVEATERRLRGLPRLAVDRRAGAALLWRHRALVALLAGGLAVRAAALVAIYPGFWFTDSNGYVSVAATGQLLLQRVSGYALFVWPFYRAGSAGALVVAQHLLALGMIVLLYALLVRRGVPRWLAVLGVVPLALDAYQLAIEHAIMSDTVFHACVVGTLALLLWRDRPGLVELAAAGLLLGYAGLVRSVGAPFLAVFVVYLLVRRLGWRSLVAFVVPWVAVTAGYAALFHSQTGKFALNEWSARFLYARVEPLASCKTMRVPLDERFLCPKKQLTTQNALWGQVSPIHDLPHSDDATIRAFATRVIEHRPLAYAHLVAADLAHYFEPGHRLGRNDYKPAPWEFPAHPEIATFPGYRGPIRPQGSTQFGPIDAYLKAIYPNKYVSRMVSDPRVNRRASNFLRGYQRYFYTSGQILGVCLLLVIVALARRRGDLRLRLDAALLAAATVVALLTAAALSVFSYRYGLTAVVLLPPAAALAGASLLPRRGAPAA
jgi:hypothetical protein